MIEIDYNSHFNRIHGFANSLVCVTFEQLRLIIFIKKEKVE